MVQEYLGWQKSMFEKPWPSAEFRKYETDPGWTKPTEEQRDSEGTRLIGLTVFVEGEGEGKIVGFNKSKMEIDFVLRGQ